MRNVRTTLRGLGNWQTITWLHTVQISTVNKNLGMWRETVKLICILHNCIYIYTHLDRIISWYIGKSSLFVHLTRGLPGGWQGSRRPLDQSDRQSRSRGFLFWGGRKTGKWETTDSVERKNTSFFCCSPYVSKLTVSPQKTHRFRKDIFRTIFLKGKPWIFPFPKRVLLHRSLQPCVSLTAPWSWWIVSKVVRCKPRRCFDRHCRSVSGLACSWTRRCSERNGAFQDLCFRGGWMGDVFLCVLGE